MHTRSADGDHAGPASLTTLEAISGESTAWPMVGDHHRLLVDNTDGGLILADHDGRILSANPSAQRLLGVPLDELRGQSCEDPRWGIVDEHGRRLSGEEGPVTRALRAGEPVLRSVLGLTCAFARRDGDTVWLEVSCEPLYRSRGERPYAVVVSLKDITQRREADDKLRESEARYRMLADNSSDVITRMSRSGVLTWISPSVTRLLGYSPEGLLGARAAYVIHPDDLAPAQTAFRALCDGSEDSPADSVLVLRLRRRGGDYVDVEVAMRVVRNADGSVTEIQSSTRDITDRLAAEAARRTADDVFRLALEHAPIGMAIVGLDHRWITVNSALPRITGHSPADFERLSILDFIHPDDRTEMTATMAAMIAGNLSTCEAETRMLSADGGFVWIERGTTLVRDSSGAPSYFVMQAVDISDRMHAQQILAKQAVTDPLTGLANRSVLQERLERAMARCRRDGAQVGLIFIDLDHFKSLNDVFGHDAGDEVLRQVAARLALAVREQDTAVRLGGDEFVVLCESVHLSDLRTLADRLFMELSRPYELAWGEANISGSFGLAVGTGPDASTLIQQADAAMYRSKQEGRSRINTFDDAAMAGAINDLALEAELQQALDRGELRIHYQPVVDLADRTVRAREALVRWQHPKRGLLEPASFIQAAEQSRLVAEVGDWMLGQAVEDAKGWDDEAVVCVNISARHLAKADFSRTVIRALDAAGLPGSRLQLELTENSILQASAATLAATSTLTDLGVTLAIDDFGLGYSSVAALHKLPITTLKIDQSFVANLPGDAEACTFVTGLLRMGAGLGIAVVAEGVETVEQAQWLRVQRCPLAQGYYFGRPAPEAAKVVCSTTE